MQNIGLNVAFVTNTPHSKCLNYRLSAQIRERIEHIILVHFLLRLLLLRFFLLLLLFTLLLELLVVLACR